MGRHYRGRTGQSPVRPPQAGRISLPPMAAKNPIHVTVTGAAGQIGYALLFRIASGALLRARPAGGAAPPRDRARHAGPRGRGDGARRLCIPPGQRHRDDHRPQHRIRRHLLGAAGRLDPPQGRDGAGRPADRQRRDLRSPGPGHRRQRRLRRARPGGGKPVQHQLPHRPRQRPRGPGRPLVRHDPPRREPGEEPAGEEGRGAGGLRHQPDHLGQPLGHAVPRRGQRPDRRQAGRRGHRRHGLVAE